MPVGKEIFNGGTDDLNKENDLTVNTNFQLKDKKSLNNVKVNSPRMTLANAVVYRDIASGVYEGEPGSSVGVNRGENISGDDRNNKIFFDVSSVSEYTPYSSDCSQIKSNCNNSSRDSSSRSSSFSGSKCCSRSSSNDRSQISLYEETAHSFSSIPTECATGSSGGKENRQWPFAPEDGSKVNPGNLNVKSFNNTDDSMHNNGRIFSINQRRTSVPSGEPCNKVHTTNVGSKLNSGSHFQAKGKGLTTSKFEIFKTNLISGENKSDETVTENKTSNYGKSFPYIESNDMLWRSGCSSRTSSCRSNHSDSNSRRNSGDDKDELDCSKNYLRSSSNLDTKDSRGSSAATALPPAEEIASEVSEWSDRSEVKAHKNIEYDCVTFLGEVNSNNDCDNSNLRRSSYSSVNSNITCTSSRREKKGINSLKEREVSSKSVSFEEHAHTSDKHGGRGDDEAVSSASGRRWNSRKLGKNKKNRLSGFSNSSEKAKRVVEAYRHSNRRSGMDSDTLEYTGSRENDMHISSIGCDKDLLEGFSCSLKENTVALSAVFWKGKGGTLVYVHLLGVPFAKSALLLAEKQPRARSVSDDDHKSMDNGHGGNKRRGITTERSSAHGAGSLGGYNLVRLLRPLLEGSEVISGACKKKLKKKKPFAVGWNEALEALIPHWKTLPQSAIYLIFRSFSARSWRLLFEALETPLGVHGVNDKGSSEGYYMRLCDGIKVFSSERTSMDVALEDALRAFINPICGTWTSKKNKAIVSAINKLKNTQEIISMYLPLLMNSDTNTREAGITSSDYLYKIESNKKKNAALKAKDQIESMLAELEDFLDYTKDLEINAPKNYNSNENKRMDMTGKKGGLRSESAVKKNDFGISNIVEMQQQGLKNIFFIKKNANNALDDIKDLWLSRIAEESALRSSQKSVGRSSALTTVAALTTTGTATPTANETTVAAVIPPFLLAVFLRADNVAYRWWRDVSPLVAATDKTSVQDKDFMRDASIKTSAYDDINDIIQTFKIHLLPCITNRMQGILLNAKRQLLFNDEKAQNEVYGVHTGMDMHRKEITPVEGMNKFIEEKVEKRKQKKKQKNLDLDFMEINENIPRDVARAVVAGTVHELEKNILKSLNNTQSESEDGFIAEQQALHTADLRGKIEMLTNNAKVLTPAHMYDKHGHKHKTNCHQELYIHKLNFEPIANTPHTTHLPNSADSPHPIQTSDYTDLSPTVQYIHTGTAPSLAHTTHPLKHIDPTQGQITQMTAKQAHKVEKGSKAQNNAIRPGFTASPSRKAALNSERIVATKPKAPTKRSKKIPTAVNMGTYYLNGAEYGDISDSDNDVQIDSFQALSELLENFESNAKEEVQNSKISAPMPKSSSIYAKPSTASGGVGRVLQQISRLSLVDKKKICEALGTTLPDSNLPSFNGSTSSPQSSRIKRAKSFALAASSVTTASTPAATILKQAPTTETATATAETAKQRMRQKDTKDVPRFQRMTITHRARRKNIDLGNTGDGAGNNAGTSGGHRGSEDLRTVVCTENVGENSYDDNIKKPKNVISHQPEEKKKQVSGIEKIRKAQSNVNLGVHFDCVNGEDGVTEQMTGTTFTSEEKICEELVSMLVDKLRFACNKEGLTNIQRKSSKEKKSHNTGSQNSNKIDMTEIKNNNHNMGEGSKNHCCEDIKSGICLPTEEWDPQVSMLCSGLEEISATPKVHSSKENQNGANSFFGNQPRKDRLLIQANKLKQQQMEQQQHMLLMQQQPKQIEVCEEALAVSAGNPPCRTARRQQQRAATAAAAAAATGVVTTEKRSYLSTYMKAAAKFSEDAPALFVSLGAAKAGKSSSATMVKGSTRPSASAPAAAPTTTPSAAADSSAATAPATTIRTATAEVVPLAAPSAAASNTVHKSYGYSNVQEIDNKNKNGECATHPQNPCRTSQRQSSPKPDAGELKPDTSNNIDRPQEFKSIFKKVNALHVPPGGRTHEGDGTVLLNKENANYKNLSYAKRVAETIFTSKKGRQLNKEAFTQIPTHKPLHRPHQLQQQQQQQQWEGQHSAYVEATAEAAIAAVEMASRDPPRQSTGCLTEKKTKSTCDVRKKKQNPLLLQQQQLQQQQQQQQQQQKDILLIRRKKVLEIARQNRIMASAFAGRRASTPPTKEGRISSKTERPSFRQLFARRDARLVEFLKKKKEDLAVGYALKDWSVYTPEDDNDVPTEALSLPVHTPRAVVVLSKKQQESFGTDNQSESTGKDMYGRVVSGAGDLYNSAVEEIMKNSPQNPWGVYEDFLNGQDVLRCVRGAGAPLNAYARSKSEENIKSQSKNGILRNSDGNFLKKINPVEQQIERLQAVEDCAQRAYSALLLERKMSLMLQTDDKRTKNEKINSCESIETINNGYTQNMHTQSCSDFCIASDHDQSIQNTQENIFENINTSVNANINNVRPSSTGQCTQDSESPIHATMLNKKNINVRSMLPENIFDKVQKMEKNIHIRDVCSAGNLHSNNIYTPTNANLQSMDAACTPSARHFIKYGYSSVATDIKKNSRMETHTNKNINMQTYTNPSSSSKQENGTLVSLALSDIVNTISKDGYNGVYCTPRRPRINSNNSNASEGFINYNIAQNCKDNQENKIFDMKNINSIGSRNISYTSKSPVATPRSSIFRSSLNLNTSQTNISPGTSQCRLNGRSPASSRSLISDNSNHKIYGNLNNETKSENKLSAFQKLDAICSSDLNEDIARIFN